MNEMMMLFLCGLLAAVFLLAEVRQYNHAHEGTHHRHKIGHKHGEGFVIDMHAYASKISHWNPTFKVILAIVTLVLCIALNNPCVSVAVLIAMAYLTMVKGGLSVSEYLSVMMIPIVFILLGTLAIAIEFSYQPIGQYNLHCGFFYIYTSQDKLKEMIFLILKVFASVSALQMMTLSTPSSEIISVMRKAHVPTLIIELMNIIYRYIFILLDVYSKMKNSADSRQGYCDFRTSCYTFGGVAGNMLIVSLKKANVYYDAMESRCYDGEMVFLEEEKKVEAAQIIAAAIFVVMLLMLWWLTK
jgi:cobalt ABC transporter, permease protein CbiQ